MMPIFEPYAFHEQSQDFCYKKGNEYDNQVETS